MLLTDSFDRWLLVRKHWFSAFKVELVTENLNSEDSLYFPMNNIDRILTSIFSHFALVVGITDNSFVDKFQLKIQDLPEFDFKKSTAF